MKSHHIILKWFLAGSWKNITNIHIIQLKQYEQLH